MAQETQDEALGTIGEADLRHTFAAVTAKSQHANVIITKAIG
jgi:hypothetical protein